MIRPHDPTSDFVTSYAPLRAVLTLVERVAHGEGPVLISGESGTGKRHLARMIHGWSRRPGPMIVVDCLAQGERGLESELVGADRTGALTPGVPRRIGAIEMANSGTLVLDGIAALPMELQAKLSRAIEHRLLSRGPAAPRLIAIAHRPLRDAVDRGEFKEALREQISTTTVQLPPLRDRISDVAPLAEHFARRFAGARPSALTREAIAALESHDWPGNVRELRNVIERAMAGSSGREIGIRELTLRPVQAVPAAGSPVTLDALARAHIEAVLQQTNWHQGRAVELLGISPKTLYRKMREFGIARPRPSA